jgi:hypothetical protein
MIERPKTIVFSHIYEKFPAAIFGTVAELRTVDLVPRDQMLASFVEYDTVYILDGKRRHFPLNSILFTVLGFDSDLLAPRSIKVSDRVARFVSFTTCRPFREWSHAWYRDQIGNPFKPILSGSGKVSREANLDDNPGGKS